MLARGLSSLSTMIATATPAVAPVVLTGATLKKTTTTA